MGERKPNLDLSDIEILDNSSTDSDSSIDL